MSTKWRQIFRINLDDFKSKPLYFCNQAWDDSNLCLFLLFFFFFAHIFCASRRHRNFATFHTKPHKIVNPIDLVQSWKWCKIIICIMFFSLQRCYCFCFDFFWLIDFLLCHFSIDFTQFNGFPVSTFYLCVYIKSRGGNFSEVNVLAICVLCQRCVKMYWKQRKYKYWVRCTESMRMCDIPLCKHSIS